MSAFKDKYAPLFLFFSAFLWSLCGIFTKTTKVSGLSLATLRGLIAFTVVLFLLRGKKIVLNRNKIIVAVCYFVQGALFVCANKLTTAANATVLQNMSPLVIILLNAALIKKLPSKKDSIVCTILFTGIAIAFAGNIGGGAALGNMLAIISAFFYAGVFFFSKEAGSDPLESLLLGNGYYLLLLPVFLTDSAVWQTRPSEWLYLLFFATISGIGAWLCFSIGIRHTSALQANFITMSEPVMAPLWTFIFLKEKVSLMSFIGCAMVIITLLIYNIQKKE